MNSLEWPGQEGFFLFPLFVGSVVAAAAGVAVVGCSVAINLLGVDGHLLFLNLDNKM